MFFFYYLYFILNMSYKIQYIIMHLLQSKHTLPLFLRFALVISINPFFKCFKTFEILQENSVEIENVGTCPGTSKLP